MSDYGSLHHSDFPCYDDDDDDDDGRVIFATIDPFPSAGSLGSAFLAPYHRTQLLELCVPCGGAVPSSKTRAGDGVFVVLCAVGRGECLGDAARVPRGTGKQLDQPLRLRSAVDRPCDCSCRGTRTSTSTSIFLEVELTTPATGKIGDALMRPYLRVVCSPAWSSAAATAVRLLLLGWLEMLYDVFGAADRPKQRAKDALQHWLGHCSSNQQR